MTTPPSGGRKPSSPSRPIPQRTAPSVTTSPAAPAPRPARQPSELKLGREELDFTYARSSGAGGQNVNKVNSKAILRWNPRSSNAMNSAMLERFLQRYDSKLTVDGELILMSDVHRDQGRNTAECIERLKEMIQSIAVAPKKRHATKPTYGSKVRRLKSKKVNSDKKNNRRVRSDD